MVKVAQEEESPSVLTMMQTAPALASRLAGTKAVSFVALTYVVVSAVVPQVAFEAAEKFVPLMVSVKAALPAAAVAGLRLPMEGAAASAAGAHANARIAEKATVDQHLNQRALCICNHLSREKLSISRHSLPNNPCPA